MSFLTQQPIIVLNENQLDRFQVPDMRAIWAIEKLIAGLAWIYDEFMFDCGNYKDDLETAFRDEDFIMRNTTRTLAYANQAGLLEGLVKKTYNDAVFILNKKVSKDINIDYTKLNTQYNNFKNIKVFRDKVAAHLSLVFPKNDNISTQLTSLATILGGGFSQNKTVSSFSLGGGAIKVNEEYPNPKIPSFGIEETHKFLILHYKKWGTMFDGMLKKTYEFLPIDNENLSIVKIQL